MENVTAPNVTAPIDIPKLARPADAPSADAASTPANDETQRALVDEVENTIDELDDLSDLDLVPQRAAVEAVAIEIPQVDGTVVRKKVLVRRLDGEATIAAINDLASLAFEKGEPRKDKSAVSTDRTVLKLKRCLANPDDHSKPRFNDVQVLKFVKKGDAELINSLLLAIHKINPLVKN